MILRKIHPQDNDQEILANALVVLKVAVKNENGDFFIDEKEAQSSHIKNVARKFPQIRTLLGQKN